MAAKRKRKSIEESDPSDEKTDETETTSEDEECSRKDDPKDKENKSQNSGKSQENKTKRPSKKSEPEKKIKKVAQKITAEECEVMIQNFLVTKIRPYLHTELILTFKNEASKADVTTALASLTEKGILMKKEFGKTVLYLATKQVSNMPQEEIDCINKECEELINTNKGIKEEIQQMKNELKILCEYPKDDELIKLTESKKKEATENIARMDDLSSGKIKISKEEMVKLEKELCKLKKMRKERMTAFKEIVNVMMDNTGMKKSELYEEVGIDD